MYELTMHVDELNTKIMYRDYKKAITEFKECVVELFKTTQHTDDFIMKICKDYAICVAQGEDFSYTLELKLKEVE
jgi:hypothetical protein